MLEEKIHGSQKYKVLGAMLALDQFTIKDLAEFSGVNETTVRTVINRNEGYLEKWDRKVTGQRGGKPIIYRVREDQLEGLRSRIDHLFQDFQGPAYYTPEEIERAPEEPVSLSVAENYLERASHEDDEDKKRQFLKLADLTLRNARDEFDFDFTEMHYPKIAEHIKVQFKMAESLIKTHHEVLNLRNKERGEDIEVLPDVEAQTLIGSAFRSIRDQAGENGIVLVVKDGETKILRDIQERRQSQREKSLWRILRHRIEVVGMIETTNGPLVERTYGERFYYNTINYINCII